MTKLRTALKYISLGMLVFIIAATKYPEMLRYNFLGLSLSQITIVKLRVFLGILFLLSAAGSLLIYRPFCRYLCPVAAVNSIISFSTSIIRRGGAPNHVVR